MKKSLGRVFLLLLLPLLLFAKTEQAEYTLTTNKKSAYVKEAVEISFVAKQVDHTYVMFFFLEPKKSKDYDIKLLNKKTTELGYHDYTTTFTYLLFPLKAKKISVDFDFTIKVASDEAVAQVFQGSRDNTKWIETIDTKVSLQPINIEAKKLKKHVDLVGDFRLNSTLLKDTINEFDAANITYQLIGTGYKDKNFDIITNIPNVSIFSQKEDAFSIATKDGYKIHREYSYAMVSKEDFTIPKVSIEVYSPKQDRYYTLTQSHKNIKVTKLNASDLLDEKEFPQSEAIDIKFYANIAAAIVIFLSGFLTAKLYPLVGFKRKKLAFEDIRATSTAQELILVLLQNHNEKESREFINRLELLVHTKSEKGFKEIKKELLESL